MGEEAGEALAALAFENGGLEEDVAEVPRGENAEHSGEPERADEGVLGAGFAELDFFDLSGFFCA